MVSETKLTKLLDVVVTQGGSDLHVTVGRPPAIRLHGTLRNLGAKPLTGKDTVEMMRSVTPRHAMETFEREGGCDFGFAFGDRARFRVSVYKQRGCVGMVLRLIPSKFFTFEQIGLPPTVKELCMRPRGMVLVTGPTGSGKTTTLATMVDYINAEDSKHIVTVEDPIEYYHKHRKSILTQREVGEDVPSFSMCLRRVLRSDPDVIMVGEMRDLETISAAITAAETGHLVLATLHTTGSANTVNRIVDAFPQEQQEQIRVQMAQVLIAVISQVLLPRDDIEGRIAVFELMMMTDAIKNLIRENKVFRIPSVIQTSSKQGMILLDDRLYELWRQGKISFATALNAAEDAEAFKKKAREHSAQLRNRVRR